jgi:hypothetical protein
MRSRSHGALRKCGSRTTSSKLGGGQNTALEAGCRSKGREEIPHVAARIRKTVKLDRRIDQGITQVC